MARIGRSRRCAEAAARWARLALVLGLMGLTSVASAHAPSVEREVWVERRPEGSWIAVRLHLGGRVRTEALAFLRASSPGVDRGLAARALEGLRFTSGDTGWRPVHPRLRVVPEADGLAVMVLLQAPPAPLSVELGPRGPSSALFVVGEGARPLRRGVPIRVDPASAP